MTVEADKAMRGMRNVRRRYDALLRENKGKRPTTYAKLRNFTEALMVIVNEEACKAGFLPSITPSLEVHTPSTVPDKGNVAERKEEEKKAKELALQAMKDMKEAEEELEALEG